MGHNSGNNIAFAYERIKIFSQGKVYTKMAVFIFSKYLIQCNPEGKVSSCHLLFMT